MPHGNVLVVEDDDAIRRVVVELLREHSLQVSGARDGADALHQISTRCYSVIVLDLVMPYMSGVDFLDSLAALLSDPSLRKIESTPAVIVITGMPDDTISTAELQRRFPTLVRAVLRKPLDCRELAARVEELLE